MRAAFVKLLRPVGLISAAVAAFCVARHFAELSEIRRFAAEITVGASSRATAAQKLNHWVFENTDSSRNRGFFLFPALRATPLQVLAAGGDCADKSRLLSALLESLGISASPMLILDEERGRPIHTVVAAWPAPERVLYLDPVFGVSLELAGGSLEEATAAAANGRRLLETFLKLRRERPWPSRVFFYGVAFDRLSYAVTLNPGGLAGVGAVEGWFAAFIGHSARYWRRPMALESPPLVCAIVFAALGCFCRIVEYRMRSSSRTRESKRANLRQGGGRTGLRAPEKSESDAGFAGDGELAPPSEGPRRSTSIEWLTATSDLSPTSSLVLNDPTRSVPCGR